MMDSSAIGAKCPYCRTPWTDDQSSMCPECGTVSHRECWTENGGCAVLGCAAAPPDDAPAVANAWQVGVSAATTGPPSTWQPHVRVGADQAHQHGWNPAAAAPTPAPTSATPAPGWYVDPVGEADWRWWDGSRWTHDVHPAPEATTRSERSDPSWAHFGDGQWFPAQFSLSQDALQVITAGDRRFDLPLHTVNRIHELGARTPRWATVEISCADDRIVGAMLPIETLTVLEQRLSVDTSPPPEPRHAQT